MFFHSYVSLPKGASFCRVNMFNLKYIQRLERWIWNHEDMEPWIKGLSTPHQPLSGAHWSILQPDPPSCPPTSQVGPIENRSQFPTIPIFEKKKNCGFIRYIMHQKVTTIYNPILSWLNRHVFVKNTAPKVGDSPSAHLTCCHGARKLVSLGTHETVPYAGCWWRVKPPRFTLS